VDNQRFDAIAKQLATGVTRRRAMKAVLGGAVAVALVPLAGRHAQAGACVDNCDCPKNSRCSNGQCTTERLCVNRPHRKFCKFSAGSSGCIDPSAETCPKDVCSA
jgi:hypothetical protein